ncbi:conserved Plasmodium protein, unknown function [Plasmodium reichenowi]|uniref:Homologous recombination OB-fold protein OB-fold domain-containing protein n=1 Tax=Plasmodium reichenowi TaxID=5854 RepID=A0A060RPV6_PLARE|nr:conserved Plasmodium protein, unknown function [Plasmodium reichenowi]
MLDENLSCLFDESDDEWKKKKKKKKEEGNIQLDDKKRNEKNVQQKNSSSSILNFNISNIKNLDNFFKSINNENINKSKSNNKLRSVGLDHVENINKERIDDNNKCPYDNTISNMLNKKGGDNIHATNNENTKKQAILKNKEINNKHHQGDKKFLDDEYNKDENCSSYEEKKKQRYNTNTIRSITYNDRNRKHKYINNDDNNNNNNNEDNNNNNNNNEDNYNNNIHYCDTLIKQKNIQKKDDMYIYTKDNHMNSNNGNSLNKDPGILKKKKNTTNETNLHNEHIRTNNSNNNISSEKIGDPAISEQYEIHESNRTKHMTKLTNDMKSFSPILNICDKSIIQNVSVNVGDKTSNLDMFIESYNKSEMTKIGKDNNNIYGNNLDCNNVYSNNICNNNMYDNDNNDNNNNNNNTNNNNNKNNNNSNYYNYNKEKELIFCFSFIKYYSWIKALQILNIPIDFFHLGINSHKYIHKNKSEESFLYKYNIHNILKNKHFSNYKIERMIVLVKNIICRNHGYFLIVMDPSGQMPASVHKEVEIEYKKHIDIGSTLLLKNVTIFDTIDNFPYLIVTLRSLVRVIKPEQTDALTKEKIFKQIYL